MVKADGCTYLCEPIVLPQVLDRLTPLSDPNQCDRTVQFPVRLVLVGGLQLAVESKHGSLQHLLVCEAQVTGNQVLCSFGKPLICVCTAC